MPQATNPPTLNRNININIKTDFTENNDSFCSEIASESENVKEKSEDEAEETVFDVKEKRKPEKNERLRLCNA